MTVRWVWVVAEFFAGALVGGGVGWIAGCRAGLHLGVVDIGKVLDALEAQYDSSLMPAMPTRAVERPGALRVIGIMREVLAMVTGRGRAEA